MSLRTQVESAVWWSGITNLFNQAWLFAIQVLLARLIDPLEFGVIAAVAILLAVANVLIDGGFGQALVQKPEVDATDISSVFYFNLLLAGGLYVGLCLAAPAIAEFFREPRLREVLPILGLGLLITAFGQTQQKMLSRHMQFSKLFWITIPGNVVGGLIGVGLAVAGWGLWALVGFQLTSQFARTVFLWRVADRRFRPGWSFNLASLRAMTPFGAGVLGENLVAVGLANVHGFAIARLFPLADLAFYSRANNLQSLPATLLTQTIGSVLFPTVAGIRDAAERQMRIVREAMGASGAAIFPVMLGLIALADPLIVTLLTDKWSPSIGHLRLLPIVGICYALSGTSLTVLRSLGMSGATFQLALLKNVIVLGTLAVSWRWGLTAIVIGQVLSSGISLGLNALMVQWRTGYRLATQASDLTSAFLAASVAAGSAWFVSEYLPAAAPVRLLAGLVALAGVYSLACRWGNVTAYRRLEALVWQRVRGLPGKFKRRVRPT